MADVTHVAMGRYGERLAARYLQSKGLQVLEANYRCSRGEIDLVLRDGEVLVVCEVKTRTNARHGSPLEAVGSAKFGRLRTLASCWMAERGVRAEHVRFDVVAVQLDLPLAQRVTHVRGIS